MLFYRDMLRETRGQHIHHKKHKQAKPIFHFFPIFFLINQTFLVNIYAENTANLQNRDGRDFFGGVQPVCREKSFQKHISQHLQPSTS